MKITVKPTMDGLRIRETPVDGKPIGQVDTPDVLEVLEPLETLRNKLGVQGEWLKIRTPDGVEAYAAAWFLSGHEIPAAVDTEAPTVSMRPVDPIAVQVPKDANGTLYVRPMIDGLRLREKPVDGTPVGQVSTQHVLKVLETPDAARGKLGTSGAWLHVRTPDGRDCYTAAWLLELTDAPKVRPALGFNGTNMMGVNLDHYHSLGTPNPAMLKGMGWVRFGYNVSAGKGSQDIKAAYDIYRPLAERYVKAGMKVMFVVTHQTYGEGVNAYWPWNTMTDQKWRDFTGRFTDMVGRIAAQYDGQDLVHCWQIWNEQDAHVGAEASVPMNERSYAHLLAETIRAVRAVDPDVAVITGGHTKGPGRGVEYARNTVLALPADIRPDGIAFHPYGRGTRPGTRYCNWGHIEEEISAYAAILPDRPVWITEWGALDKEGDPAGDVAQYASEFIAYLNQRYSGRVAAAIWYAYAMGMHNGYGLVGRDGRPMEPLYSGYLALRGGMPQRA